MQGWFIQTLIIEHINCILHPFPMSIPAGIPTCSSPYSLYRKQPHYLIHSATFLERSVLTSLRPETLTFIWCVHLNPTLANEAG